MQNVNRTTFDAQYKHIGHVRHGIDTSPGRVEFDAPVKDVSASTGIYQGSVVSLDSTGSYIIGCAAGTAANHPVPCISLKNVLIDPDVTAGYRSGHADTSTFSAVGGKITAIPCTCGYELETTEYDTDATYAINDALTPATSTKIGKLTKATANPGATEPYMGYVSIAPTADQYKVNRLAFFASFIPAAISTSSLATSTFPNLTVGTYDTITVATGGIVTFSNTGA